MLSLAVTAGCTVAYVLFRTATSPLLDVERAKFQPPAPSQLEVLSPDVLKDAEKWFIAHPWVATAGKHFRDKGRYLFCEKLELSNDRKSIIVSPVAMLWRSKSDEVPVTIVADSARLTGSGQFSLDNADFGQIKEGVIRGNVQVRGPRNLRISGGVFYLRDLPMRLLSSEQVDFQWDRHEGVAASGVEIQFDASGDEEDQLADLKKVQLLGRVICNFVVSGSQPDAKATRLQVNASRGFDFDNTNGIKTGTFHGFDIPGRDHSHPLNAKEEVWVRHFNDDGSANELICPELRVTFGNEIDPVTGDSQTDSLVVEHVQAWGRRVEIQAPKQNVSVLGNDLQYFVGRRKLELRNTTDDVSGAQKLVTVQRGRSVMKVPSVRILHTAENTLQRLECNGKGAFLGIVEEKGDDGQMKDASKVVVRWGRSLVFQSGPNGLEQFLTLNGGGSITELVENVGLAARQITMTMLQNVDKKVDAPKDDDIPGMEIFQKMEPKLLTATGGVVVKSPEGSGTLRETLTVRFRQEADDGIPVRTASATSREESESDKSDEESDGLFSFEADTADAQVIVTEADDDEMPPYQVWLNGNVEVARAGKEADKNFTAWGNQLRASNGAAKARMLQLFGDPAKVESTTRNLEGPRIDLNELDGKADVVGSGKVRFTITKGFDGKELPNPTPLDIYWSDRMAFQQRSAHFSGKVRVVMNDPQTRDVELLCDGLTVHFSRDISLDAADDSTFEAVTTADGKKEGPIERLLCHNRVNVRVDQFESGNLVGTHYAEFADLKLNMKTGDFSAVGPGYLRSVSPDKEDNLKRSVVAVGRPNTPSQTRDTGFVYLRTDFVGGVDGNVDRQEARLSQNVVALLSPVSRVDERINLQQTPTAELPDDAGILQAETVTIAAIWGAGDKPESFSLNCQKNARLDAKVISASADVITYDHSKEQFIIRAEGDNRVTVNHRSGTGGQFNRTSGTRFEYYLQTNQLDADKIDGLKFNE